MSIVHWTWTNRLTAPPQTGGVRHHVQPARRDPPAGFQRHRTHVQLRQVSAGIQSTPASVVLDDASIRSIDFALDWVLIESGKALYRQVQTIH